MKKILKKELGITLVALIITIIILLLLAGITIGQLTGSGLFENAKIAKDKYENATEVEKDFLENYENEIMIGNRSDTISIEQYNSLLEKIRELEAKTTDETINEKIQTAISTQLEQSTSSSDTEYHKGDSLTISYGIYPGILTTGNKQIMVGIPLGKNIGSDVKTITFSSGTSRIRATGGYLITDSSGMNNLANYFTVNSFSNNMLVLIRTTTSSMGGTNNTPVVLETGNLIINFK